MDNNMYNNNPNVDNESRDNVNYGSDNNTQDKLSGSNYVMEHQWQPYSGTGYVDNNSHASAKPKKTKKKKEKGTVGFGKVVFTCLVFMLITILVNVGIIYYSLKGVSDKYVTKTQYASENIGFTSDTITSILTQTGSNLTVAQIAEAVMPSVVAITSTSIVEQNYNPFFGYGGSYQVQGAGSGIIVGKNETELLIVTNNHVVEGTTALTVQFTNEVSIDEAYVKGTSADNDIAVVAIPIESIDTDTVEYIKIATLGDSDALNVGDGVIAIGNALGYGQSLTVGYISAKNRDITIDNTTLTVIQTDAAINGGNSGGALINMNGEVIGINVAKSSSSSSSGAASVEGMGYAIPISQAKEIIEELSNRETRYPVAEEDKGYLGVSVISVDSTAHQYYDIPKGAYIREITKGGPAEKAGLVAGDVIVAVNGADVDSSDALVEILDTYAKGEQVTLTVMVRGERGYVEKEVNVTLVSYEAISAIDK